MHKRNLIILIISVTVLAAIWIFRQQYQRSKQQDIEFNLSGTAWPDKIKIYQDQEECQLINSGNGWLVNSTSEAKVPHIELMLSKLKLLKMDYPVPRSETENLMDTLLKHGRSIELIQGEKIFYSLRFMEYKGKNIALNRKDKPFYVIVPGNRFMSLEKLIPAQAGMWTKNTLIDIQKSDIVSIKLIYPKEVKKSFKIEQPVHNKYMLFNNRDEVVRRTDATGISDYLKFFKGITYFPFSENSYILNSHHYFELKIKMRDSTLKTFYGYELKIKKERIADLNYCGIIINKEDTVIAKYTEIDPLLVEKDYFLKK